MEPAKNQITLFKDSLAKMDEEFKCALPPQIDPKKFVRTLLTTVQMNPDLLGTDRRSLLGACMKAAQDGLLLDGREAAPVIFKTKNGPVCQYMPMVGGILKKIRNSGEIASIAAHVVYERDHFDYELGDEERISHKPHLGAGRGEAIAVYAIAKTKDGAIYREVMSVGDVEKVRAVSKAAAAGPWSMWWDEMARKTIIRRLAKRLPSSADVDQVLLSDNDATGLEQPARRISAVSTLNAQITGSTAAALPEAEPESDELDMAAPNESDEEEEKVPAIEQPKAAATKETVTADLVLVEKVGGTSAKS